MSTGGATLDARLRMPKMRRSGDAASKLSGEASDNTDDEASGKTDGESPGNEQDGPDVRNYVTLLCGEAVQHRCTSIMIYISLDFDTYTFLPTLFTRVAYRALCLHGLLGTLRMRRPPMPMCVAYWYTYMCDVPGSGADLSSKRVRSQPPPQPCRLLPKKVCVSVQIMATNSSLLGVLL